MQGEKAGMWGTIDNNNLEINEVNTKTKYMRWREWDTGATH